ncbi:MAG TPA: Flp family type IVb pilin [Acidimicrobiales bacterium]|nr:Flp family type IVb pilin [Acidimicrobiales bacterium]
MNMTYITQQFVQQLARIFRRPNDESGAAMVEYALLVALIAAVCIAVLTTLGTHISGLFTTVTSSLP